MIYVPAQIALHLCVQQIQGGSAVVRSQAFKLSVFSLMGAQLLDAHPSSGVCLIIPRAHSSDVLCLKAAQQVDAVGVP